VGIETEDFGRGGLWYAFGAIADGAAK
jgi:hypothetical protein